MNTSGIIPTAVRVILSGSSKDLAACGSRREFERRIGEAFPGSVVEFTPVGTDIARVTRKAVEQGAGLILVGGGDGTVRAAASAVIGTEAALGALPLGTLNHFAKDLGIPPDPGDALSALSRGDIIPIDTGEVNGHVFVNNSGLGLYPLMVRMRESGQSRGFAKWPSMFLAVLRAFLRYPTLTVRVTIKGRQLVRTTPVVFVGNNEYTLEGPDIGSRSRLDAGRLFLVTLHPQGRLGLAGLLLRAAFLPPRGGDYDIGLAESFRIESRSRRLLVSLDGEVTVMTPPLQYRIRPGALRVLVPPRSNH